LIYFIYVFYSQDRRALPQDVKVVQALKGQQIMYLTNNPNWEERGDERRDEEREEERGGEKTVTLQISS
jgi:hypothetical protein